MKKLIVPVLLILIMVMYVFAWEATRTISGQEVTLTINPTGGSGIFTVQETLTGPIVTQKPAACAIAGNKLTCDYDFEIAGTLIYTTTGSGTVSGVIVGRDSGALTSTSKSITGDSAIPKVVQPIPCTANQWVCVDTTKRKQCTALGIGYSAPEDCPLNTICVNGVCQAVAPVLCTAADWELTNCGPCTVAVGNCGTGTQTCTITKKAISATCTGEVGKPAVNTQSCTLPCPAGQACLCRMVNEACVDGICQAAPCDATHLVACDTQLKCTTAGLYWYNACYTACPANTEDPDADKVCTPVEEEEELGTLGQQIDAVLGAEKTTKIWTTNLISKIAHILKYWFSPFPP